MIMKLNFTAPINTLSYGICGLNVLKELVELGHEISYWPIGPMEAPPEYHNLIKQSIENTKHFDYNAPSLRLYHQFDMAQHVGKGMRCGFPIFELNKFTEQEKHHLCSLDKIFVCSEWAKTVMLKEIRPIHSRNCTPDELVCVIPLGVDRNIFNENVISDRKDNTTTFLNIGKWEIRKGHDVLLEAFNEAFTIEDDVLLIMHCPNIFIGENENKDWHNLYLSSKMGQAGKIKISTDRLQSQQEVAQLISQADCGVFPSKAEGWNLEALEMMSMGKSIIITDYSGHTEFCTNENSLLISIDGYEEAYDGVWFHGQGEWAELGEKQFQQLINYMKDIHDAKQNRSLNPNHEGINTAKRFTWKNTAEKLCLALSQ